jgi:predicted phosphodiesterase
VIKQDIAKCPVCKDTLRPGRVPPYCSKKCQATKEGYSERWTEELESRLQGSTAWRPEAIEPIHHVISGHPVGVLSDIHCPLHSVKWLYQAIRTFKHFGVKKVIVSGDFIDANQISRHIGGYYRRRSELEDDFKAGESLLSILSDGFEEIIFLNGNHCGERLVKVFRGEVAMQRLWKMFGEHKNVKVAARSFVFVNNDAVVGHPRQYSKMRGGVPQNIAQVWQKHIALGHGHHSAQACSRDGKWQAVDMPCLAELDQFEYTTFEINDMPKPKNGFMIVFGNKFQVFNEWTPWEIYKDLEVKL